MDSPTQSLDMNTPAPPVERRCAVCGYTILCSTVGSVPSGWFTLPVSSDDHEYDLACSLPCVFQRIRALEQSVEFWKSQKFLFEQSYHMSEQELAAQQQRNLDMDERGVLLEERYQRVKRALKEERTKRALSERNTCEILDDIADYTQELGLVQQQLADLQRLVREVLQHKPIGGIGYKPSEIWDKLAAVVKEV